MNRRKNTKSMWSKFGSPTNHSVTNLLIEPPASSTTKLLRGNKSTGGCDNHSYYAATGTYISHFTLFILFFSNNEISTLKCHKTIFLIWNWTVTVKVIPIFSFHFKKYFFSFFKTSCNYTSRCTNGIGAWFNIGTSNTADIRCQQCGGGSIITGYIDRYECSCLIICRNGTNANPKSIIFRLANHDRGQRYMVSGPTQSCLFRCTKCRKNGNPRGLYLIISANNCSR